MQPATADPFPPDPVATPVAGPVPGRIEIETLDLHCAGEPLRLIRRGLPPIPDAPILQRRRWVAAHADHLRRALILEPRGHRDMYGAILLPPHDPGADVAVLFLHNEGYSTMCGHGIIAIATGLVEEGLWPARVPETTIRFETPAGLVTAHVTVRTGTDGRPQVEGVCFANVPAWRQAAGIVVAPDGIVLAGGAAARGGVRVDLAYGGAYYGIVDVAELGLRVHAGAAAALTRAGAAITDALRRDHTPVHPADPDLGFVYGTILVDHAPASAPDGRAPDATLRTVTIFADAEVDRSPCGSGTSALLAALHAGGRLATGGSIVNAGITGERFTGTVTGTTSVGPHAAVATTVEGRAFVTGRHRFIVDERDPLGGGFLLR